MSESHPAAADWIQQLTEVAELQLTRGAWDGSDAIRWLEDATAPPVPAAVVHIWRATAHLATAFTPSFLPALSDEERSRASRLRLAEPRACFIVSRILLRCVLADWLGVEPAALRFEPGRHGKPQLSEPPNSRQLEFSLSRAHNLTLIAIAEDRNVGVDVERMARAGDEVTVARRFFAPADAQVVAAASPAQRSNVFLRLWTRMEAVLKADGCGLAGRGDDAAPRSLPPGPWSACTFVPAPRHIATLAVRTSSAP